MNSGTIRALLNALGRRACLLNLLLFKCDLSLGSVAFGVLMSNEDTTHLLPAYLKPLSEEVVAVACTAF